MKLIDENTYSGIRRLSGLSRAIRVELINCFRVALVPVDGGIEAWILANESGIMELTRYYLEQRSLETSMMLLYPDDFVNKFGRRTPISTGE